MRPDVQKWWNESSGVLESLGAGPLPGAHKGEEPDPKIKKAAHEIMQIVLVALMNVPENEIRGKRLHWLMNLNDFAWKHGIGL